MKLEKLKNKIFQPKETLKEVKISFNKHEKKGNMLKKGEKETINVKITPAELKVVKEFINYIQERANIVDMGSFRINGLPVDVSNNKEN